MSGETRVAASPETVKKFLSLGCSVMIERGAGEASGFDDLSYSAVGAELINAGDSGAWGQADVILCVQAPPTNSLKKLRTSSLLVGLLSPYSNPALSEVLQAGKLSAIALELLPRISRAQSADALSSQANIAGYKAILLAAGLLLTLLVQIGWPWWNSIIQKAKGKSKSNKNIFRP